MKKLSLLGIVFCVVLLSACGRPDEVVEDVVLEDTGMVEIATGIDTVEVVVETVVDPSTSSGGQENIEEDSLTTAEAEQVSLEGEENIIEENSSIDSEGQEEIDAEMEAQIDEFVEFLESREITGDHLNEDDIDVMYKMINSLLGRE